MTRRIRSSRSQPLDAVEDGALPDSLLDRVVGGRGRDQRQEMTSEAAAALTAAEPAGHPQQDTAKPVEKAEKPFKTETTKPLGPLELTKTTKDGWDEKKGAWVKGKEFEIAPKKDEGGKSDKKDSELGKAVKDGVKDAVSEIPGKIRDGYQSLAQANALKSGESERNEAIDKIRAKAGAEAKEDGKVSVKVTEKDGATSEKTIDPKGKPIDASQAVGNWDPLKAGSKGLHDGVSREANASYKVDKAENLSNEAGSLKSSEKVTGEVRDARVGTGSETTVGGVKLAQTYQAGASTLTETSSKSTEVKSGETSSRETEHGTRAGAKAEVIATSKIGELESSSKIAAGVEAGTGAAGKTQSGAFGGLATGSAQANAEAKAGFDAKTKIGEHVETRTSAETAVKAQVKAEGTAFADKQMLAAGASGAVNGSVQVKAGLQNSATIAGAVDVSQKMQATAKAEAGVEGSAQASLMGVKAEGAAKVAVQAEAKVEQRVGIKELGDAGLYQGGAAKAQAEAGAKAGARLGLLEGAGGSAKAEASARAEAGGHQGVDYGVGSATMTGKVFAQAKAEAKAEAEIAWNPADKIGAKVGVGAIASAGVGVSVEKKIADKGGHSAAATATIMSPGAIGGKVSLDCSLKDGELKFKIGGALGLAAFGIKIDAEVNLNLKPQKQALDAAIKELKAVTPESILKNPDSLAPAVTKAAGNAADTLIKEGKAQGGLGGKITEMSGHVLKAVNDNITKPLIKPLIELAKPLIKVVEKVVPKPIVQAATTVWNWFTGLFRR